MVFVLISIHALVKRATVAKAETALTMRISIHALVKRATTKSLGVLLHKSISIHALVKRATTLTVTGAAIADISIHALVKRATLLRGRRRIYYVDFNPRPREKGDGIVLLLILFFLVFQSTPS